MMDRQKELQDYAEKISITRNILLNPGPATTTDTVKLAQVIPDICPREQEFSDIIVHIQEQLVSFAGSATRNVCVLNGGSGTAAVEMVISSVIPVQGALLVVNNGAYAQRIINMATIYNIRVIEFLSPINEHIDYDALHDCFVAAQTSLSSEGLQITHMAAIHHETSSGLLNDSAELGGFCKTHGISCILDAMSSYGGMPMDMDSDNIDYLISSSNKNIQGMAGIGIIICNKTALQLTEQIPKRNLYLNLFDQYQYFQKTQQFRFTPPVQTVYALYQAIQETIAETIDARYKRYQNNYRVLRTTMTAMGFKILVPDTLSSGFITTFFEPREPIYTFDEMHAFLLERGFTIYPGKISSENTFRIATIGDIYEKDINNVILNLKKYLVTNNITRI